MTLSARLEALSPVRVDGTLPEHLTSLTDNSREVTPGGGFIAVAGSGADGHDYIGKAIAAGARVVFCQRIPSELPAPTSPLSLVQLADTRRSVASLAQIVYGSPSNELKVLGVTGTNGKTTVTYMLESMGAALGHQVGVIGTISHRYPGFEEPSINTTPGVLKMTSMLRAMVTAGVDWVALEVSSHGLEQRRLEGITFDAAVWTNMRQDHLDFHGTFARYHAAKTRFFTDKLPESVAAGKQPWAILNAGDKDVRSVFEGDDGVEIDGPAIWYAFEPCATWPAQGRRLAAVNAVQGPTGWDGDVAFDGERAPFTLPLVGRFNVLNGLGAVGACLAAGAPLPAAAKALAAVRPIPGRMEALGGTGRPRVFVDYAHTPDALAVALETLRETSPRRLWVVFGAGGDRDQSKRMAMGQVAASLADRLVVTNDNPRTEDPAAIAQNILDGMAADGKQRTLVELDRRKAIGYAVAGAGAADIVLVAGKGHENYQIVGTKRRPMDDTQMVRDALAHWKPTVATGDER